ncbi:NACHT, LRR and PYD domains-containing protein 12-like isoform X2 [Strongylocentrotus purpuratus]|uniref:NACHT domain-containing protein n=1 Tax=Strongylocentrotus purpuratus TaxID=7668 RepID=A0A7M7SZC1_STRPU|nr:NACHT, LRR and PYD domains-containing protein 12-like isoform X2 [Strongylocentrotus purpuratus]
MGKTLSKKTKKMAEPAKDDRPSTSPDNFTMGKKFSKKTEEMTEPPRDDIPSTSGQTSGQTNGFHDVITKVADAISDDGAIRGLGRELNVQMSDINRALETNWAGGRKTSNGNVMLLQKWAGTVKPSKQLPTLRAALIKVGLLEVEETCFTSSCSGDDEAMPSDIMKLREQLKNRYRKKFGQIKTSPVNPNSWTWLQHIYVSLVLMLGSRGEKEEPIDYDGLFKFIKTDTPTGFVTRLAFIGEAGVGKSTLFAKIALDWAEGKILQEINLLFLESFREIKESGFFGDTVMGHFPDDLEVKGERVDEYIRTNQRKALILLDGLDEAQIDIKKPKPNDAIVSIVRGERFINTPVLITTRPFGADQIKSIMKINDHYTFGKVKGFTKENMATYIKNYFKDDFDSASTLVNFIDTNQVVSEYLAPFPIFCSMLCSLWKTPCERENIQTMETFSQLFKRIVFSLQEQYFYKPNELEEDYESRMRKASESLKDIGCIAFQGLLVKQLIFDEKALESCTEAAMTACEIGILSKEIRPAPLQIRESQRKQFIQEFSFPHKLLQEYIASFYLASLFHEDRQEFNRILTHKLLKDYTEFRYVLYFTAAQESEVGESVMEALCNEVNDTGFIFQCAFECHDPEAIGPVRNLLKTKTHLMLPYSASIAAFLFPLETIGKEIVRRSSSIRETLGVSESFEANASSSGVAAAVGLFTLQNLRELTIEKWRLDDKFYTGMSAAAPQSMIEELTHRRADLGFSASSHYARGLCFMPNLRSLNLDRLKLSDEFYSTIATEASKSKIEELTHENSDLGSAASSHYARGLCSMPNLRSMKLDYMELSDEFYSTMLSESSKSKIQMLSLGYVSIIPCRLHSILSLPHLQSLSLTDIRSVDMDDGETLTRRITSVDELSVDGKHVTSLWNLGLHTSCPGVKQLKLDWWPGDNVAPDIVTMACCPFHHLTHLHIQGLESIFAATTLSDPVSFCKAVITSCPQLNKLSITRISLYNEKAAEIIKLMTTHTHLTIIALDSCRTDADLAPLLSEVKSEGKLTVSLKHGGGRRL